MGDPKILFKDGNPQKSQKREIVFRENQSIYRALNGNAKWVCEITIDGALITDGKKCDRGLWVDDGRLFLIELKGSDTEQACKQLSDTYDFFIENFRNEQFKYNFRVVCTRVSAPNLQYHKQRLEKRTGRPVLIKEKIFTERL